MKPDSKTKERGGFNRRIWIVLQHFLNVQSSSFLHKKDHPHMATDPHFPLKDHLYGNILIQTSYGFCTAAPHFPLKSPSLWQHIDGHDSNHFMDSTQVHFEFCITGSPLNYACILSRPRFTGSPLQKNQEEPFYMDCDLKSIFTVCITAI